MISSLDLFPTLSALAAVPLPTDRVYDGRDMSHILVDTTGTAASKHDYLFIYGGCSKSKGHGPQADGFGPSAVRAGQWKAYWCTGMGLGGDDNETIR